MSSCVVWAKLRDSNDDAIEVKVHQTIDFDDLKEVVRTRTGEKVKFIYATEHGEDSKCEPDAFITSHGQVGSSKDHPYYYSIVPSAGKD